MKLQNLAMTMQIPPLAKLSFILVVIPRNME